MSLFISLIVLVLAILILIAPLYEFIGDLLYKIYLRVKGESD